MKQKLLLLNDVDDLGKKGEVVEVKPGYARNFLLPSQLAVLADAHTLRIQQKLKDERAKQAVVDRKDADDLAQKLLGVVISTHVKVDPEGKMYGSVSAVDILDLLAKEGFILEKKNIFVKKPIKETGVIEISLKLKEGVESMVKLKIIPELMNGEIPPEIVPPTPVASEVLAAPEIVEKKTEKKTEKKAVKTEVSVEPIVKEKKEKKAKKK